ncbi:MAG: 2-C-methyl-D-erythritol 4-phosphate cytidylyltransferase [Veillonellaceae bacterium]|nr:2-C-methyl-D-erythritol 4-phosphate cytidylyltransferase [Veillonellaceae bacterium]
MTSVIFPAAGVGKRMHAGQNKVFMEVAGLPVLVRSLMAFATCPGIGQLIVAIGSADIDRARSLLNSITGLGKCIVVEGGSERQYSIRNAMKVLSDDADIVLVHDAARPLVSRKTIEAVKSGAIKYGACIAAVPEKNTIKVVDDGLVVATPDRSRLWAVQTPQGFRRDILEEAYKKAEEDGFLGTDDASLVERLGIGVHAIMSDYSNIKLTTPEDIPIAESILARRQEEKS